MPKPTHSHRPSPRGLRPASRLYALLLRLYPQPHRERFGEGMRQTFNDLRRDGSGLLPIFLDTFVAAMKARISFHFATMKTSIIRVAFFTGLILMIPVIMMKFSTGWNWDAFDFAFMGTLLFVTGMTIELMLKKSSKLEYRLGMGLCVLTSFFIVYVNAAVGIIGEGNMTANFLYLGAVFTGVLGTVLSRLESKGLMIAALVTAGAVALVPVLALFLTDTATWGSPGVAGVFMLNSCLVGAYVLAAALFRNAAQDKGMMPSGVVVAR